MPCTRNAIVEFTDEIRRNACKFFHAVDIEKGEGRDYTSASSSRATPRRHAEATDPNNIVEVTLPDFGKVTIVADQTFGVEIELTTPQGVPEFNTAIWNDGARTIIERLTKVANLPVCQTPLAYHQNADPTRWVVESDGSAGWEVVSPVLSNADGLFELRRVCDALTELINEDGRFHVNYRTGFHLTLGTRLNSDSRLRGFLKRLQRLEPGLMTLVSPSRLFGFDGSRYNMRRRNIYCRPTRESVANADEASLSDFAARNDRYYTVNLSHAYDDVEKLEVRLHNGTTEFRKVVAWLSLWMLIFNTSRYKWDGSGINSRVFPRGNSKISKKVAAGEDIFKLLQREGIFLNADLSSMLRQRRNELRAAWEKVLPRRVSSWGRAGWYDEDTRFRLIQASNPDANCTMRPAGYKKAYAYEQLELIGFEEMMSQTLTYNDPH